ncbi:hypothetical protein [Halodesulfovibrio aestuarii]|uniref:DUF697 domain-containing protein n=1 Tax=Halodesulfovibrio aestuarii TaxID=126333 RepID=A0ABV4JW98_9BACT
MPASEQQISEAKKVIAYYTLAASSTGAVPVPASSAAIIAENGFMLAHIASKLGQPIEMTDVISALGIAGGLNIVGRNVFIEGAKLLSWGTGSLWAMAGLSALGASTAGLQTYMIGMLAIEIGKNNGQALSAHAASKVRSEAKTSYDAFKTEWKDKKIEKPV